MERESEGEKGGENGGEKKNDLSLLQRIPQPQGC